MFHVILIFVTCVGRVKDWSSRFKLGFQWQWEMDKPYTCVSWEKRLVLLKRGGFGFPEMWKIEFQTQKQQFGRSPCNAISLKKSKELNGNLAKPKKTLHLILSDGIMKHVQNLHVFAFPGNLGISTNNPRSFESIGSFFHNEKDRWSIWDLGVKNTTTSLGCRLRVTLS